MELTNEQISEFASRHGVKKIAVENFLGTISGNRGNDEGNLRADALLYKWNSATVKAIRAGINLAYSSKSKVSQ